MTIITMREKLIRAAGGANLFEQMGMLENASMAEAKAVMAGSIRVGNAPISGIAPWSARLRTDHHGRLLRWIVFVVAAFLLWAGFFTLDKVTRGQGRVLPSVQNQVVQHLEGGIVQQLLVHEGERVRKGQVLMRLANITTGTEFATSQTDVIAKKITLARMEAEISGAGSFTVPEELAKAVPAIAAGEVALFNSRRAQRSQQAGIISQQARGRRAEVASLHARLGNLHKEESLMLQQLDKLERAYREEAISEREVLDKRQALASLRTRMADVEMQIPQSAAQISEAEARRGEVWTHDMEDTKTRAATLRLELAKADEQYSAAQDKTSREEIRAPMDGVVNKLYVQTVGGGVRSGEPIAEIVPVDRLVMVEAHVAPKDRGNIWPGLPAQIKISAYDSAIYGGLDGKVLDISPDVMQDPKGEPYYRVRLRADTASFGASKPVIPGMTAEVNIRSGSQTILDYILGPLIRIRDEALRE